MDPEFSGFKTQFKKADRENARLTIIIGEDEVKNKNLTLKYMDSGKQEKIDEGKIIEYILKGVI